MRLVATYVGGMDGAVVPALPSGRTLTLPRNEPVEVWANEAEHLAAHPEIQVSEADQEQAQQDPPAQQDTQKEQTHGDS